MAERIGRGVGFWSEDNRDLLWLPNAIALSKNAVFHEITKHVAVKDHFDEGDDNLIWKKKGMWRRWIFIFKTKIYI